MVAEFVVYVIGPTKPADGEKKRHEQVSQEQFLITYYFHDNGRSSLAANVPTLVRIAEGAAGEGNPPPVHLSAAELRHVIDDFSATIASSFLGLPPFCSLKPALTPLG